MDDAQVPIVMVDAFPDTYLEYTFSELKELLRRRPTTIQFLLDTIYSA